MTIKLSSKGGGGSGGVTETISIGNQVASGSSGELFNVDPGAGFRVQITGLASKSARETNIRIKFGDRIIYTGSISDEPLAGDLSVFQGCPGTTTNEYNGVGTISLLKGYADEILTIRKTSGTTGAIMYLSYIITD